MTPQLSSRERRGHQGSEWWRTVGATELGWHQAGSYPALLRGLDAGKWLWRGGLCYPLPSFLVCPGLGGEGVAMRHLLGS